MDGLSSRAFVAVLAFVTVAAALIIVLVLAPRLVPEPAPEETPPPHAWALPVKAPPASTSPARTGVAGLADEEWVAETAELTEIPARVLAAYAGVALWKAEQMPSCSLGWTTLAAIGSAESDHGRHGGSQIGEDGTARPPIVGVALDGASTALIPDTDGGEFDGDAEFDRAVGPMQLLPETWRNWHVDGGGDGVEDPQNIDDAVMAAANYLCRASGDMGKESGWRAGVHAYNRSSEYVQTIAEVANRFRAVLIAEEANGGGTD